MLISRKRKKKLKSSKTFKKNLQLKFGACILLASSLESRFTSPSTSNNFLNESVEPNLLKKEA